ncbi:MAG TPA: metallophosphoesterase family protein [Hyphomicrobiaceae bacterium]|nr:metallophosphoesterase family protein [Hyphomicrobiaceae bacterium]
MIEFDATAPLLVFGGPYSNLRATEALMAEAERLGVGPDRVICTGDVVAYCAEPEETARAIAAWGCRTIQGNCEQQLAEGAADCACNFEEGSACDLLAKGWYPYANARISPDMRAWMAALPQTLSFKFAGLSFRVVHGGVEQVNRWVFASDESVLAEEAINAACDVVIAGHCGLPFIQRGGRTTWFNPGVIGMPANDGTADVWYGLVSSQDGRVVLSTHRLSYDHMGAAAAMRRSGHANGYARTLVTGLWPSLDIFPPAERDATGKRIRARKLSLSGQAEPGVAMRQAP